MWRKSGEILAEGLWESQKLGGQGDFLEGRLPEMLQTDRPRTGEEICRRWENSQGINHVYCPAVTASSSACSWRHGPRGPWVEQHGCSSDLINPSVAFDCRHLPNRAPSRELTENSEENRKLNTHASRQCRGNAIPLCCSQREEVCAGDLSDLIKTVHNDIQRRQLKSEKFKLEIRCIFLTDGNESL